ncbi:MAG: DUF2064 domain-containing protein [Pseudomonadota bacterium]|nr:DUF2064 domain-containing protein [Pseudomonadota bacterium]
MNGAIAIFVKTPGYSPIKTRLALELGEERAMQFHQLSAAAVASVAQRAQGLHGMSVYWAVAEAEAVAQWTGFPAIAQAPGGLGERMARVHAQLVARHGFGILIGADTPQLATQQLEQARQWLSAPASRLALGRAHDGGFWLFGANLAPPLSTWNAVEYSAAGTAEALRSGMEELGSWHELPVMTDADHARDLPAVLRALDALPGATPEQQSLAAWIHGLTPRLPV